MANNSVKGIVVNIGGDTVDLQKSLKDVNGSASSIQKELNLINKSLKFDPENTVLLAQKQEVLSEKITVTKEKLESLKSVQSQVESQFKSGELGADKHRAFQREIEQTMNHLDYLQSEFNETETKANKVDLSQFQGELNDLKESAGNLKDTLSDTFADIGKGVAVAGAGVVGAVMNYDSVDSAMNALQAKTGLADDKMKALNNTLEAVYKNNYGDDMTDVANVMATVVQFTNETDPTKVQSMTENLFALRDVFDYDYVESLRTADMLTKQFGITSDEAFNLIVRGTQNGLNKNGDFLDTLNEYSVHYRQLGYNADEFINSLLNGTEAGTFSVDKLGDAMKEFGIRSKDTAKSTTDALEMLGYGAGKPTKEIADTKDKIAELEKNLKYAKLEQQGFNEKTSELTRLKNADKIAEYSKELENAKNTLKGLSTESSTSLGSIEDLQSRFAQGGETAREATDEVLTALFAVDDEVQRNAIGVGLFGTMWEDLGIDGVKALMDVSNEASNTTSTMEEIKDINYDDVKNDIGSIGRKFQTDIINPLIEDFYPDIEDAIEWTSEHLDDLLPIIGGVAGATASIWAGKKVNEFTTALSQTITTFRTLKTATDGATIAQNALNTAQKANVIGLAIGAIGTLISAGMTLASVFGDATEETDELKEEQQKLHEELIENQEAYEEMKAKRDEEVSQNTSEFQYYRDLKEELDQCVDANGKIKTGYEERANVITTTLSEALGVDIEKTGNVLTNYKDISKELDNIIQKKEAEGLLDVYQDSYSDSIKTRNEKYDKYLESEKNLTNYAKAVEDAEEKFKEADDNWKKEYARKDEKRNELFVTANTRQLALDELNRVREAYAQAKSDRDGFLNDYHTINNTIDNYESLQAAIVSEDIDRIKTATENLKNNFVTAENATRESLTKQHDEYTTRYHQLLQAVEDGTADVSDEMLTQAKTLAEKAKEELKEYDKIHQETGLEAPQKLIDNSNSVINDKGRWSEIIEGLKQKAEEINANFTDSLADPKGWSKLFNRVRDGVKFGMVGGAKLALDINSPSKEGRSIGRNFIDSIGLGSDDEREKLKRKITNVSNILKTSFDDLQNKDFDFGVVARLNSKAYALTHQSTPTTSANSNKSVAPVININFTGDMKLSNPSDIKGLAEQLSREMAREIQQQSTLWG